MGRPVIKSANAQIYTFITADNQPLLEFVTAPNETWRSLVVSLNRRVASNFFISADSAVTFSLQVNQVPVLEWRITTYAFEPAVFVLPWGDGLTFANREQITIAYSSGTLSTAPCEVSATLFGSAT